MNQGTIFSAVQNSGRTLTWDETIEVIGEAEAALINLKTIFIDEKHRLEARIRLLERQLREAKHNG